MYLLQPKTAKGYFDLECKNHIATCNLFESIL